MVDPDPGLSDAALVDRARRGDAAAFEVLVRRHFRAAYAVALGQLGVEMDAEDVCQDAFVRALERLEDCRHPDRFRAWLLQIVRNRGHNYRDYRRRRAGIPLEQAQAARPATAPRDVERSELAQRLLNALGELTALQRQVVLLHDMEGWKHREIAQVLGMTEVNSRQHLFVARRELRKRLGEEVIKEHFDG